MPDLELLRSDLGAFADTAGSSLTEHQVASFRLETRTTAILANRQAGKSRSLGMLGLWEGFRNRGHRILIISAGEEASRRLLAEIRRVAVNSPLLAGSIVDETAGLLTLTNGSEIRSVPASERQVRGWSVNLLLVDEAGLVPEDLLLGAAIPTTAARPDAKIVLAGSALTASGPFFDAVKRGETGSEHTRTFVWTLDDCPWISPTAIQSAREALSPQRFAAEYLGQFADGADALFSRESLDRVTADFRVPSLAELRGPARVLAGVDWGWVNDRSCLVAIARLPEAGPRRFGVVCAERWPAGAPLGGEHGVPAEIARSPTHFHQIVAEANGLGGPTTDELWRRLRTRAPEHGGGRPVRKYIVDAHDFTEQMDRRMARLRERPPEGYQWASDGPFHTKKVAWHVNSENKAATYSALRLLIDREILLLPESAVDLRRELLMLKVDLSPTGSEKIEARSGHDDVADALSLALGPYRARDNSWRTVLADLADPERSPKVPKPTAESRPIGVARGRGVVRPRPLPPPTGSTVTTGGGIEVPRQPVFQSIAGSEVSGVEAAA